MTKSPATEPPATEPPATEPPCTCNPPHPRYDHGFSLKKRGCFHDGCACVGIPPVPPMPEDEVK